MLIIRVTVCGVYGSSLLFYPFFCKSKTVMGSSLAVQRLGPCVLTANGPGSMSGQGTKIPQAVWHGQKQANKKCCRKLSIFKEPSGLLMVTGDNCGKW